MRCARACRAPTLALPARPPVAPQPGGIKRWGFARGLMTHGSKSKREHGSTGPGSTPGRVFPGLKAAGQMGNIRAKLRKVEVRALGASGLLAACFLRMLTWLVWACMGWGGARRAAQGATRKCAGLKRGHACCRAPAAAAAAPGFLLLVACRCADEWWAREGWLGVRPSGLQSRPLPPTGLLGGKAPAWHGCRYTRAPISR